MRLQVYNKSITFYKQKFINQIYSNLGVELLFPRVIERTQIENVLVL